jgi:hypothetical protein
VLFLLLKAVVLQVAQAVVAQVVTLVTHYHHKLE